MSVPVGGRDVLVDLLGGEQWVADVAVEHLQGLGLRHITATPPHKKNITHRHLNQPDPSPQHISLLLKYMFGSSMCACVCVRTRILGKSVARSMMPPLMTILSGDTMYTSDTHSDANACATLSHTYTHRSQRHTKGLHDKTHAGVILRFMYVVLVFFVLPGRRP